MSNNFENFGTAGQQDAGQEYAPATMNAEGMKFDAAPGDAAVVVPAGGDQENVINFSEIHSTDAMAERVAQLIAHQKGELPPLETLAVLTPEVLDAVESFPELPGFSEEDRGLLCDYAEDSAVAAVLAEAGSQKAQAATIASAFDSAGREREPMFCDKVAKWSRAMSSALIVGFGASIAPAMANAGEHERPSIVQLFKKHAEREIKGQVGIAGSEAGSVIGGVARVVIVGGVAKVLGEATGVKIDMPPGVVVQGGQVPPGGQLPPLPGAGGYENRGYGGGAMESNERIALKNQLVNVEAQMSYTKSQATDQYRAAMATHQQLNQRPGDTNLQRQYTQQQASYQYSVNQYQSLANQRTDIMAKLQVTP